MIRLLKDLKYLNLLVDLFIHIESNTKELKMNSKKELSAMKEPNITGEVARTIMENPELKKANKEENKDPKIGCQECKKEKNMRARLECNHACCNICLMKYASNCFLEEKHYNYCAPCELCNKTQRLSIV